MNVAYDDCAVIYASHGAGMCSRSMRIFSTLACTQTEFKSTACASEPTLCSARICATPQCTRPAKAGSLPGQTKPAVQAHWEDGAVLDRSVSL